MNIYVAFLVDSYCWDDGLLRFGDNGPVYFSEGISLFGPFKDERQARWWAEAHSGVDVDRHKPVYFKARAGLFGWTAAQLAESKNTKWEK